MAEPQSLMLSDKQVNTRIGCADGHKGQDVRVRHQFVLALYMTGHSPHKSVPEIKDGEGNVRQKGRPSIQELTQYSVGTIHDILRRDDVCVLRQQLLESYEIEFEMLLPLVVESLRKDLTSDSPDREDKARRTWLRYMKKPKSEPLGASPAIGKVSAEQVVFNILQKGNGTSILPTQKD